MSFAAYTDKQLQQLGTTDATEELAKRGLCSSPLQLAKRKAELKAYADAARYDDEPKRRKFQM